MLFLTSQPAKPSRRRLAGQWGFPRLLALALALLPPPLVPILSAADPATINQPAAVPDLTTQAAAEGENVPKVMTAPEVPPQTAAPMPDVAAEPTPEPEPSVPVTELPFAEAPVEEQLRRLVDERIQASAFLLIDAHTGETVLARNEKGLYPPASTTKLLTALLAYELVGMEGNVTVQEIDTKVEPSHVPLLVGEVVPLRALIYSTLIGSDNDSAAALGRHAAGTLPDFMDMMNRYAQALGCVNTTFKNPNGLPAEGQFTTASDLMIIFRRVLERPALREICRIKEFPLSTAKGTQTVRNHNKLLGRYIGMGPAKTGWTRASQHTYAAYVSRGDRAFILTLLKSPNKWFDSRLLFDYAFSVRPPAPGSVPPGVPEIPLVVQNGKLVTLPGGEVKPGQIPPEGLLVIKEDIPAGPLQATATLVKPKTPAATKPAATTSRGTVTEAANGTRYLSSALEDTDQLPEGFRLANYTIQRGDTLALIASNHGCTVEMIVAHNNIPNRHLINVGQILRVPTRR